MQGPTAASRAFHVSLNVADLGRSVAFYRVLFNGEPAKSRPDYAKFEVPDPALVLSLEPQPHTAGGSLNHLGLRVPDAAALVEVQRRLELAGIGTQREEGVECCYARQTKFWVADPDRNLWEVYLLEADLAHRGMGDAPAAATAPGEPAAAVAWEHRLGEPLPTRLPLADDAADRVLLRGTFNADLPAGRLGQLVAEARRVLRPGGRLTLHALVANRPLSARPHLPGPAAAVERVPLLSEPLGALEAAGFAAIHLERLGAAGCFELEGNQLRELLLVGTKVQVSPFALTQAVIYRGPFRTVTDDHGTVYRRGEAVSVPTAVADLLRRGPLEEQFIFLAPGEPAPGESPTAAPEPAIR
jgi:catechol 2,3-dioxygenase-like lactoylglutathione lyase family enzyme